MRLLICASILLGGCADADNAAPQKPAIERVGYLESRSLREASGLAYSNLQPDLLWAINDDGPATLFAMDTTGRKRGKVGIAGAKNRDWEDLAAFTLDGTAYLLVADVGDNQAQRRDVTLYVLVEPDPDADEVELAWEIEFTFPEGPRDVEAVAVDPEAEQIYVISKRDIPARLYSLPLRSDNDEREIAEYLGSVSSLPQPSRRDVNNARAANNWHWQPTGMDVSNNNDAVLVLTYHGVYYYARRQGEAWYDTLQRSPSGVPLGKYRNAEAIAFSNDGRAAYVTTEKKHAPLLRVNLEGAIRP